MAIAFVQQKQNTTAAATTIAATFTGNTISGNFIFVSVHSGTSGFRVTGVSDGTNTYTQIFQKNNTANTFFTEIWVAKNITGGVTPTVTATLFSSVLAAIQVFEISGVDTVQPIDYINSRVIPGTAGGTVYSLATAELKTSNEIAIATVICPTNAGTLTAGGSLVNFQTQTNASGPLTGSATQIVASKTALSLFLSLTTNTNGLFTVVTLADQTMPAPSYPAVTNNFQFASAPDPTGNAVMSITEKIR